MIKPSDIIVSIDSPKGHGLGIQSRGVTVTHIPTGVKVYCDDHRSEHRNRAEAVVKLNQEVMKHELINGNSDKLRILTPKEKDALSSLELELASTAPHGDFSEGDIEVVVGALKRMSIVNQEKK